jgi:hypothetical protein
VENPGGNRLLGRPRWRHVDIILKWILERFDEVVRIDMARDRSKWKDVMNAVMNPRVPYNFGRISSGCTAGVLMSIAQNLRNL